MSIAKNQIINYQPEKLNSFHVYMYEWIDNVHFTLDPAECLSEPTKYLDIVQKMFLKGEDGWNGDGEIKLMWIPPFVLSGQQDEENTKGIVLWHVKQLENGISWILSPIELPFKSFGS
jgi:hypothetical protein